jgi:hypothetical protein
MHQPNIGKGGNHWHYISALQSRVQRRPSSPRALMCVQHTMVNDVS